MIVKYKDYIIDVKREKCMAGYTLLYYSVASPSGEEIICDLEDSSEKVRDMVKSMKNRIDEHILNPHSEDINEVDDYINKAIASFSGWKKQACDTTEINFENGSTIKVTESPNSVRSNRSKIFNDKEVNIIRNIIQEVIEETKNNCAVGATETAKLILIEINKIRNPQ